MDRSELEQSWDVIVIGTGMGGATAGHALAKAGRRVLFVDKGAAHVQDAAALTGRYAETFFPRPAPPRVEHRAILAAAGRHVAPLEDRSTSRARGFIPFIGAGTGGSTALYGMALERFFPADFEPRRHHPEAGESSLPESWPIAYADLAPYYEAAERLYRVRGTADPLRPNEGRAHFLAPPPLTSAGEELRGHFAGHGLHPYRLPMACEFVADCECCQGYLCPRDCKNDAARICLQPALAEHGARLVDDCEVLRLDADRNAVTSVVCRWRGEMLRLRGRIVILAAGALETPCVLLRSTGPLWPQGLANASGLVGRNLMRHYVDLHVVTPHVATGFDNRRKELAFNDFYVHAGRKFGSVQSFGRLPPAPVLVEAMQDDLRQDVGAAVAALFGLAKPVVRTVLGRLFERGVILASTLEDLPYADNRVEPGADGGVAIRYRLRDAETRRIVEFRRLLREALKPYRPMLIKQAENNQRIAHACGTCRFGHDPATSVLDAHNRAHGLENLYVLDASFFPSSGGTNPSLTIAANALRVADHLAAG